jgi:hypothetical protein
LTTEKAERGLHRVPGWARWLTGTAILALALWACDMASGLNYYDAEWFLQLLDRVGHGDALYSDRFFGVLPLSVWVGLPGVLLIGPQIAIVKGLNALASASAATLAVYAARRLGVGRAGQALVLLASVAYVVVPSYSPYKPMAYAAQVGALAAMAVWIRSSAGQRGNLQLLLAGAAVGVSVASKQTVGALALAACLVVVWLARDGREHALRPRLRDAGVLLAPALAIPALTLVPVLLAGDLDSFWRYAVTKGDYVGHASISYSYAFTVLGDLWGLPPTNLHLFLFYLGPVVAPLALLALAASFRRRGEWLLLAVFTAAAIASSYPRADLWAAIPVLSVALAWSFRQLVADRVASRLAKLAFGAAALLLAATAYATLLRPAYIDVRDGYDIGGIENNAGVPVSPELRRAAGEIGGELAAVDGGENRTFVLSPDAGFIYLVSDVHDPTRQDYPAATTFRNGERAELERRIASGEISRVCLGSYKTWGGLRPAGLESYVRSSLMRGERIGPPGAADFGFLGCRIYRSPAAD